MKFWEWIRIGNRKVVKVVQPEKPKKGCCPTCKRRFRNRKAKVDGLQSN